MRQIARGDFFIGDETFLSQELIFYHDMAPDERLISKLKDSALVVLRRHSFSSDELQEEHEEPGKSAFVLIKGHRVRVHVDDRSATFSARAGRWSGARVDYPTAGAFIAAFEEALHEALADA